MKIGEDGLVDRRPIAFARHARIRKDTYYHLPREDKPSAPVHRVRTASTLVQFHSVPLYQILPDSGYLLSSPDCRLCICSFPHPLRRLCKCFSHASDVSSQHVRAHASPSSSLSPRHSRRLLQIAQIVPPDAESSMGWNAVENLPRLHLPFHPALCVAPPRRYYPPPPMLFALPRWEAIG
jgi:hypothetical protein